MKDRPRNRLIRDTYRLDFVEGLLRLRTWSTFDTPEGREETKKQMWFDVASIQVVANTLHRFLGMADDAVVFASNGDDRLELFYGGPDDDAFVHLFNRRRKRAEYSGYKHCPLSRSLAKELVEELLNLRVPEAVPQTA